MRIAPFHEHCDLPMLPGKPPLGGPRARHDQVEAALMRRAGYEVRVLPVERGSWEENPPTVLEFTRRDLRWCQGNMQYLQLLDLPGLHAMSRFQLVWAILMFLGIPGLDADVRAAAVSRWTTRGLAAFPGRPGGRPLLTFFAMYLVPKLAVCVDVLLTPGAAWRAMAAAGGFSPGAAIELVFSFLHGAVRPCACRLFMVGLCSASRWCWSGQARDAQALSWAHGGAAGCGRRRCSAA